MTPKKITREQRLLRDVDAILSRGVEPGRVIEYVREQSKKGRGRPAIDPKYRRSATVTFRVTEEQYEKLKHLAKLRKASGVSELCRLYIVGEL